MRMTTVVNVMTGETTQIEDSSPAPEQQLAIAPILNRAQWFLLLNKPDQHGISLSMILDAVIASIEDLDKRFAFKAVAYESESYSLSNTLAIVAGLRAQGVSGLPTDAEIEAGWAVAAQFKGAADLLGAE